MNLNTAFIVAQCGGPIYGYGATIDEAVAMARRWMEGEPEIRPYVPGRMAVGEMFIAPATAKLLELVEEIGGDVGYKVIDGVAVTAEEDI